MRIIYSLILAISIVSCSNTQEQTGTNITTTEESIVAENDHNMIHQRILTLGNKLFSTAHNIEPSQPIAVGTFLPVKQIGGKLVPSDNIIGHQVQESFVTLGTQAGLNVIEFKTMPSVKLQDGYDIMLSRNIEELQQNFNAYYFLTGTFAEQSNGLIVNARIIELRTQRVIAAATDYLPVDILSNQRKVSMKNNMLYRNAY